MSNLAWDEQEEGAASPAAALVGTGLLNILSAASSMLGTHQPIILKHCHEENRRSFVLSHFFKLCCFRSVSFPGVLVSSIIRKNVCYFFMYSQYIHVCIVDL